MQAARWFSIRILDSFIALEATKDEKKSDAIVPVDRQVWQNFVG